MTGADARHGPSPRYRALSALASPLLGAWVARTARRLRHDPAAAPEEWRRFADERLGRYGAGAAPDAGATGRAWLHCASVGETLTALPLVRALAERDGIAPLVTTATPTGARVLAERAPPGTRHRYLPIDRPGPVARFLDVERPARAGIVETEIWPWLFAAAKARGVPVSILSARLSARTLRGARGALAPIYREALGGVRVAARSEADAARYLALGAEPALVETLGDLKDTGTAPAAAPAILERPYALAASTHDDEEARLARAWTEEIAGPGSAPRSAPRADSDGAPAPLLVVAPRHPDRGDAVHAALLGAAPAGTGVARRSRGQSPAPGDALYLADTLGELDAWYAHARAAFVGGSLVERGGHNLLEPARAGTPCVTGPHASNFADALAALVAADAILVAPDALAVAGFLAAGLAGDAAARARGARAREVAARRAHGVLGRYLDALAPAPPGPTAPS